LIVKPPFLRAIDHVVGECPDEQMIGIDALGVVAAMENAGCASWVRKAFNETHGPCRHAMRRNEPPINLDAAIPVLGTRAAPIPAACPDVTSATL